MEWALRRAPRTPPPASSPWTTSCINVASAERRGSRLVSRVAPCVPWVLQLRNGAVSPPAARSHGPRRPTGSSARAPHPLRPDSPGAAGLPAPSCWVRDDVTEWGPHSTQPSPAAFSRLARCSRLFVTRELMSFCRLILSRGPGGPQRTYPSSGEGTVAASQLRRVWVKLI